MDKDMALSNVYSTETAAIAWLWPAEIIRKVGYSIKPSRPARPVEKGWGGILQSIERQCKNEQLFAFRPIGAKGLESSHCQ
jgi:hypothetical protein